MGGACLALVLATITMVWQAVAVEARGSALHEEAAALQRMGRQLAELERQLGSGRPRAPAPCGASCDAELPATEDHHAAARYREVAAGLQALHTALALPRGSETSAADGLPRLRLALAEAQTTLLQRIAQHGAHRRQATQGLTALLLLAAGATALTGAARLHTERRWLAAGLAAERAARRGALTDPLTQLANRRALELHLPRMLGAAQRAGRPLALLVVDIDGFRGVNTRHGRAAGDELLRLCAQRLYAHLREADVVTRSEADRFVVALEAAESDTAAHAVAERIRSTLAEPVRLAQSEDAGAPRVVVQASVGLAMFPQQARTMPLLLSMAEQALLEAKRRGGDRTIIAGGGVPAKEPAPQPPAVASPSPAPAYGQVG